MMRVVLFLVAAVLVLVAGFAVFLATLDPPAPRTPGERGVPTERVQQR
jgi:hypothetical protein